MADASWTRQKRAETQDDGGTLSRTGNMRSEMQINTAPFIG